MTALELKFLLGALVMLLGLLAWIGRMAVDALRSISQDLNAIKIEIATVIEKHNSLEKRVDRLDRQ